MSNQIDGPTDEPKRCIHVGQHDCAQTNAPTDEANNQERIVLPADASAPGLVKMWKSRAEEFRSTGQPFERDARNYFEQSCINMELARKAGDDRDKLATENLALEADISDFRSVNNQLVTNAALDHDKINKSAKNNARLRAALERVKLIGVSAFHRQAKESAIRIATEALADTDSPAPTQTKEQVINIEADDFDVNQCHICTHHFTLREDSESTGICDECAQDHYVKQQAVIQILTEALKRFSVIGKGNGNTLIDLAKIADDALARADALDPIKDFDYAKLASEFENARLDAARKASQ